jgi:vitamin B12 transporter
MKKTLAPGVLSILICYGSLHAQDSTRDLDPVTITASSTPEKASQTGRNVLVIKGERFNDLPVHSIDELLRYLPGIEVQSRGPLGAQSDIVMRGGSFQQVLVVLDGLRLNDPNTGHFSSYIPIAPAEIDRIEIVKGASSAIYGSDAVGGVIHIITKTFAARKGIPGSGFQAQATAGSYDLLSLQAGGFYSTGNTSLSAGILSNNTSGQPQRGTHGSVYANTASFSFGHYFSDRWQILMRYAFDERKFSAQNFYTSFVSDTASERITSFWNQLAIIYHGRKDRISLNAGYKDLEDRYQFNSVGLPNQNKSKLLQALLTDEWKLLPKSTLTTGMQWSSKRIRSNDRGNHNISQAAVFAVWNQQAGEQFFASPAIRVEWNERFGWEVIPQVNLSYHLHRLQLRASAGKTIRDADFTERYNNYQKSFVSSGRIGNPDLVAEHSISYEAGLDYPLAKNYKFSATFFQRYHSMLIDYVPTPFADMPRQYNLSPSGSYALAKNIAKVNTTGVEVDMQVNRQLQPNQELWGSLGFTWLESKSSSATPSLYVSAHARWLANFNMQYRIQRFSFTVNGLYKNRKAQTATANIAKVTSDYFILNAKADMVLIKKLQVFAEADNLFNRNYTDVLGAQMPGRWLMGGIKITL